nr:hypothetical protein [Pseudomonas psychrotolerans]
MPFCEALKRLEGQALLGFVPQS